MKIKLMIIKWKLKLLNMTSKISLIDNFLSSKLTHPIIYKLSNIKYR
jgi:hypothetical protein